MGTEGAIDIVDLSDSLCGIDRRRNFVFGNGYDVVNVLLNHLEGGVAGMLNRDTVCKCGNAGESDLFALLAAFVHAGCVCRLYTVYLDGGTELFDGERDTRDQTAATDRNDDGVNIGHLIENFKTYGTLTCDNKLIIKRVNEGSACFFLKLDRLCIRIVVCAGGENDLCAETLGGFYLAGGEENGT